MFWPRLRLTPSESRYSALYTEPGSQPGVLRRIYQGWLELDSNRRSPVWNFQIARRARIMALTLAGDVNRIRIQLKDSSGEEYFPDPQLAANVVNGWSESGLQTSALDTISTEYKVGSMNYLCPFVIEPNIVLLPNQSLFIMGSQVNNWDEESPQPYRIDFCLHVWEFSGYTRRNVEG